MPDAEVSRRSFLDKLLFTSLAAVGVTALAPIPFFLRPPPTPRPPRVKVDIAHLGRRFAHQTIEYGGRKASILWDQQDAGIVIRVISHRCTHQGCDVVLDSKKWQFDCPCHGAIFGADGNPLRGPHNGPLASIPFRHIGNELEVGE